MRLPDDFVREARETMSERLFGLLRDGLEQEAPVSIRVNDASAWRVVGGEPVPWCSGGYYLPGRPAFTFDPLLPAGCYYVQEASSMFLDHVVKFIMRHAASLHNDARVLDLCAAPGGKSTILASALTEGGVLVSNEPVAKRARILSENMQKWWLKGLTPHAASQHGAPVVTNNFARDFKKAKMVFDLILCDVPCSGEGMFRKNVNAIGEWSLANVKKCQQLQREIVADIWPCLKAGGYMVYSTCTFNVHENEENVAWVADELGAEVIEIPVEREWNITGALTGKHPVCRFIPGVSRGEGLFMALLRKSKNKGEMSEERGERFSNRISEKRTDKRGTPRPCMLMENDTLSSLLSHSSSLNLRVVPNDFLDACRAVDAAPLYSLSYGQAVAYLRGEALVLDPETRRGIVPVGYQGHLLGLVKNIGNRANNLYPKEWRIKSTFIPECQEIIKEI